MRQLAHRSQPQFAITVLNGADKGAVYQLIDGRIRIGRGDENEIVIKDDPKISRNHAVIQITPQGARISDVSDRNVVIVDGEEVRNLSLSSGSVIQLGHTKFQFKSLTGQSHLAGVTVAPAPLGAVPGQMPPARSSRPSPKKTQFYIVVGVVALLFTWLLMPSGSKNKSVGLRTDEDIQGDIASHHQVVADIEAEKRRLGLDTRQFEEAQPNFIKGFRDYRKGQYERAIESFQACLSLFPNHPQCQRYLRLSQKKFSELVQYHMILANKYRSQNQYSACQASYRNAMVMLRNPTDRTYLEAKAGLEACQALEGERY
jgi:pSer/pThr/pTyr-binding forkhead associated (FHA) protein